ncbi:hypothetical protein [uncultured Microscilla sp.]|uniref:hypothetical protein n=1 Tax=uncultured Microscilla sp. TaxID=432653 RepID=UPI0026034C51|nr:hypothetical protein [uncultured Microscilla sp.]
MLNTATLDIVIALAFTYFILALMVSSINEGISNVLNMRGNMLKNSLFNLFYKSDNDQIASAKDITQELSKEVDPDWQNCLKKIIDTPFIDSLRSKADKFPKYIPPKNFVLAMMQFLKEQINNHDEHNFLNQLKVKLEKNEIEMIQGKFKAKLLEFIDRSQNNVEAFKQEIEDFYTNSVDHLRDWYRRKVKLLMFLYGLLIAVAFNVDTFYIGKILWQNPDQAVEFLATMQNYKASPKDSTTTDTTIQRIVQNTVKDIGKNYALLKPLPIGWSKTKAKEASNDFWAIIHKVFGWLVTAMAVSLGAPFWYELFNKLLSVRKSMAPAATTAPPPPPKNETGSQAQSKG